MSLKTLGAASIALLCVSGSAWATSHNERSAPEATAQLTDASGRIVGTVELNESARGVLARIEAAGLTPGWHGAHFHAVGRCDGPGFQSAGSHVHVGRGTPVHGLLNRRGDDGGDLPNLYAGADGRATTEVFSTFVTLRSVRGRARLTDVDGAAFLIHAQADDHSSQPIGGAGDRVVCGVIRAR